MLFYGFSKVPACTDPAGFFILLFPGLLDLGEVRSANSGPSETNCRGHLVCCLFWVCFFFVSVERGCHPDCLVLGNISESDSKLNSDR